jgi:chromate transporter
MAGYIGYRKAGPAGMLVALFATVAPTVAIMISLIGVLSVYHDAPAVQGMLKAIGPIIGVMMVQLTYSFFRQSLKGIGWLLTLIIGVVSLICYQFLGVHPAFLIFALLLWGLTAKRGDRA